ncbi:tRNA A64-2'-O-ribosylphosphate transferase [Salix suchowensis]|nr:tRNA A64-2'-O-ribosylphosphate transferase [Salix suchowensis]
MEDNRDGKMSIYRAARSIKRRDSTVYNALRSIYEDTIFVGEISQLWPDLPLIANLRCGLWYSPKFHFTCYFKSTDGHTNNWSFNTSRLNLHVALLSGQKGGCIIVDATRKGKRFPDSMSKTIPIWTCVLNRAILNYRNKMLDSGLLMNEEVVDNSYCAEDVKLKNHNWDCSLHLPLWVPDTEKAAIEERVEKWTNQLETSGADIASISSCLKKPLRPLWISQKTVIWLNEVPDQNQWDFTPIILVSASSSSDVFRNKTTSEFSWNYIPGAGDDEESWARGLTPTHFWSHVNDLISSGPDLCNQKVADIVERDRVYRAHRGEYAPQVSVKNPKIADDVADVSNVKLPLASNMHNDDTTFKLSNDYGTTFWIGSTNLALGTTKHAALMSNVDCILNCDKESVSFNLPDSEAHLHLPMVSSKLDRFSLFNNLPSAVNFAKLNLRKAHRLLVCCRSGEDISVCICLAILTSLFDDKGTFDDGRSFSETCITKLEMRRRLVFVCRFATTARPSRGNLKQVFGFLTGGSVASA